ncbi:MAG: hypothetical protein KAT70_07945, partial [Thermoplasmata archaeon]|nr:hypothetical protein [Thermoplasmata archaeon]
MRTLDNRGNVSFAAIAVLIFLGAAFAHAHMASLQMEEAERREEAKDFERLREFASRCFLDIESHAGFASVSALVPSRQTGADPGLLFRSEMERYVNDTFPRAEGERMVEARNASWMLGGEGAWLRDLVPVVDSERMYVRSKGSAPSFGAERNSEIGLTAVPLYSCARGEMEMFASCEGMEMMLKRSLDIPVEETFPFLLDRMNILQANTAGEMTGTARMVQYMLTTLVQYKVLQGQASPTHDMSAMDLLSTWELELAVNIAVYMEEMRAFRAIDPSSLREFDERNLPLVEANATSLLERSVIASVRERSLNSLLQRYLRDGTLDAADILALFLCVDREPIAIDEVIAQSLYTVLDQFVLKFLDYFSMPGGGLEGSSTSTIYRFSRKFMGYMGVDPSIRVQSEEFDTG